MTDVQRTLYCFGLGFSAVQLARHLLPMGWRVMGTVRSAEKADHLALLGIKASVYDGGERGKESPPTPPRGSHWLISIPPDEWGCPAHRAAASLAATASSITYLSTSGVYGDLAGGWAFETTAPNPASSRAHARLEAERQWQTERDDIRIVRLPGIYGPGRSVLDRLRAGNARRIIKPGQVFSRVHVDDIASGLADLFRHSEASGIFHLCDDTPAPPQDVITYGASLLGMDPPPEISIEDADLSPMARSFYGECKRLSNAHTKAALDWAPTYPSYREGLNAIFAAEQAGR